MVYQSSFIASLIALFATTAFALPTAGVDPQEPGIPASNGVNTVCQNDESGYVGGEPLAQYWYITVPESGLKADRMWSHLNLAGCAPSMTMYHTMAGGKGAALDFTTSIACSAEHVSGAWRSSTEPPQNIACQYNSAVGSSTAQDLYNSIREGLP